MSTETKILDIQINYAVLAKQIDDTKAKIDNLTKSQKSLQAELDKAKSVGNFKEVERLNTALLQTQSNNKPCNLQ